MEFTAVTFTGFARGGPESLFRFRAGSQLGILAAGRGGFSGGGLAAEVAVDLLPLALSSPGPADPAQRWNLAGTRVHEAIRRASSIDPFYRGMEAAFAAAHFDGHQIVVGNVGPRVYRVRGGTINQLTKDPPDENAGTAGGNHALQLDLVRFTPQDGDQLLLCTPQTYRSIHKSLLAEIMMQEASEPEVCAREIANSTSGESVAVVVGQIVTSAGRRGSSGAAVVVED
ncbi:MAG: hypothetical protein NXI35_13930 [bacterium]|nr:hypothetical protein [bacterium]